MTDQPARSFEDIKRTARRVGELLEAVQKGGSYDSRINGKGQKLLDIATALRLIAETPNASINREALDIWSAEIDKAHTAFETWSKEQLTLETGPEDDEIRF